MYEYRVKVLKVVDGDTVDVDIELGFGVVLSDERVRIMGIDTPESRTSDDVEKLFGLAAKHRLQELLGETAILQTQINKNGEDMKGKFGRILGDFVAPDGRMVTDILIEEGHCVAYFGGSKDEIQMKHMANREKLLREGIVDRADYDKAVLKEEKENK
jgi:micrococcal nuclease